MKVAINELERKLETLLMGYTAHEANQDGSLPHIITIQATPQMASDKEASGLSRVSRMYFSKCNPSL